MFDLRALVPGGDEAPDDGCGCRPSREDGSLVVDATTCPSGGDLAESPACREAVVTALEEGDVSAVRCRVGGLERTYTAAGPRLFGAAARFAVAVEAREPRLARRARQDSLAAASESANRAGSVARHAADAGLTDFADRDGEYDAVLAPLVGPAVSSWRVDPRLPPGGQLEERRRLESGAIARIYDRRDQSTRLYHLEPAEAAFGRDAMAAFTDAHEYLANTPLGNGDGAAGRAVRAVADGDVPIPAISRVLRKHVRECGLLCDLFANPALSDVYVTAPVGRNAVRVRVDGETLDTNVFLTEEGVAALASRFRRESGRGFSRARPTLDAATTVGGRRVRVAGVTEPVSEGQAFAFRAHDRDAWTLPALVENHTLSATAAGLLSVCVERGGATLLAGPRGSGKTTALGALLWEIPASVRTVVIEDAPELPAEALQAAGRDVQTLRAETDGPLAPVEALRAALRLGDGALVVGEVRGEEAGVLYEAMRVGANSEAVLGTIHGDGGDEVYERVVSDLGVPPSSFATTDVVVSLEIAGSGDGRTRRVRAIEEVVDADPVAFESLFERAECGLVPTGRIDRGNSRLIADLTRPEESYGATRTVVEGRVDEIRTLAQTSRTDPRSLTATRAGRGR